MVVASNYRKSRVLVFWDQTRELAPADEGPVLAWEWDQFLSGSVCSAPDDVATLGRDWHAL